MREVLLVGSIPLADASAVFEAASSLSPFLAYVPDGETGERSAWTQWQHKFIEGVSGLEIVTVRTIQGGLKYPRFRVTKDKSPGDIQFGQLGYADAAIHSYKEFCNWRDRGAFRPGTRFQVSLPTPFAVVHPFFEAEEVMDIWPIYERRLFEEVDEICQAVPSGDLAIQWDVACEIHRVLEVPGMADQFPVVEGLVRAANYVPADVQLGIHLCYGDPGHKHIIEPTDTALMVDLSHRLNQAVTRPIGWLHMPVPRERDDDAYFAPLEDLNLRDETELFLGLIHLTDGIEGAKRRISTATRFLNDFGVSTECGFGRRPPETISALMQLHHSVASL